MAFYAVKGKGESLRCEAFSSSPFDWRISRIRFHIFSEDELKMKNYKFVACACICWLAAYQFDIQLGK